VPTAAASTLPFDPHRVPLHPSARALAQGHVVLREIPSPIPAVLPASRRWLTRILARPGRLLASLFVALLIVATINPAWLVTGDPLAASARDAFLAPGPGHWLGTDENGRDVLTRVIYGARSSIVMGLAASGIALVAGVTIGLLAGLGPRLIDAAFMRFMDVLLAFPEILTALLVITFWGQSTFNAILAIGMSGIPRCARLMRTQVQGVRHSAYVEAATSLGLSPVALVWRHVLPNAVKPALIYIVASIGMRIAGGAALSFLGLGTPPPAPEWGAMIAVGRNFLANGWWLTVVPGLVVTLTVLSVSSLGREIIRRSEGKLSS
jgi:peptide/nickel transport system permease protein